jgi:RNA polymerase sigma-70 factor (ECF subfamily)
MKGALMTGTGVETSEPADWVAALSGNGSERDDAVRELHALMSRAARRYVAGSTVARSLGSTTREDIIASTADEATMDVIRKLATFEGRSKFTTWAYKFAILKVAVEVRRAAWRERRVDLFDVAEPAAGSPTPHDHAVSKLLSDALRQSIETRLTAHQRRVLVAVVVDGVPIDVVADRLGATRNAVYKTLHDARSRLRQDLVVQGLIEPPNQKDAIQ